MSAPTPYPTIEYRGVTLRSDPAREACFRVVHQHYEIWTPTPEQPTHPQGHDLLHANYNSEVLSLEIAAAILAEFPDAPWELRYCIARQAWDEVRHAQLFMKRLEELGGWKGEFPIINHEWNVVCLFTSLVARLYVQNRTFEGGSLDAAEQMKDFWRKLGDPETAEILDGVIADEIDHSRFANDWIQRLLKEDPRGVMRVAEAMTLVKRAVTALATQPGEVVINGRDIADMVHIMPVQAGDRAKAGFSETDIADLKRRDAAGHATPAHPAQPALKGGGDG